MSWNPGDQYSWMVNAGAATFFVAVVARSLHIDVTEIFKILVSKEFHSLLSKKKTLGAVNAICVIAVLAMGIVAVVATETKLFVNVVLSAPPQKSASQILKSFTPDVVFLCVVVVALASIVAVMLNERGGGSPKQ